VPRYPACAVGAAVLAAVPHLGSYGDAVSALVRTGRQIEPDPSWAAAYDASYRQFQAALRERGYW
jgi:sugar (pentulose or hexulose) kinase